MIPFLAPYFGGLSANGRAVTASAGKGTRRVSGAIVGPTTTDPARLPYVSPFSPQSDLNRLVWQDIFGDSDGTTVNSRAAAMRIPAVARGRNLIVSTICRFPFALFNGADAREPAPWMLRTNDGSSWQLRTAWTVDDLLFYGWSLWRWTRAAESDGGRPLAGGRVPMGEWRVTEDNALEVNGEVVPASQERDYVLFPGLHEGLLSFGVDVLSDAKNLYAVVRDRVVNGTPDVDLHQNGGEPLTPTEIDELIDRWIAARKIGSNRRGVGFTNEFVEAKVMGGTIDGNLLIEARNAAALDLARAIGIHGGMIDATTPKASLNYETTSGRNGEFLDLDCALYTTPITARLSLDDVTARGERVALDASDFTSVPLNPTGPEAKD